MGAGLERRAWPLKIEAYEAADGGRLLRLFYVPPGGADEPGGGVAEVRLAETNDAVTIALMDRRLSGTYPDVQTLRSRRSGKRTAWRSRSRSPWVRELSLTEPPARMCDGLRGTLPREATTTCSTQRCREVARSGCCDARRCFA